MRSLPPVLREIVILILLAFGLGVVAQFILPNGISLKTELTILETDSSTVSVAAVVLDPNGDLESTNISLPEAFQQHQAGSALFLDARDTSVYRQGHIRGAVNLPAHAFMDSLAYLDTMDVDRLIITYCDGSECNASIELAANLELMGFTNVRYFYGGWDAWQQADYPMEAEE